MRLNSKHSVVYISTDNHVADLLITGKINFSFKTCQLGIKTAQPVGNSIQQVFIKPSSGGTKKVKGTALPGCFRLRISGDRSFSAS